MPQQYPTRLLIQRRLTELLETITVANGYRHDLTGSVYRGRIYFGDETPMPFLSILETPIPIEQLAPPSASPLTHGPWDLVVQGFVPDDLDNPTDPAHFLLADVRKCLGHERRKMDYVGPASNGLLGLGDDVTGMYIGTGTVRPPDEISASAYFWLTLTLDVAENVEEPYGA